MTSTTLCLLGGLILIALIYLSKRKKKSNSIIMPKDLKESTSEYVKRKEDDHRKFNNRKLM